MSSKLYFPPPAKLIMGVLAAGTELLETICRPLEINFGPVEAATTAIPFTASQYYNREMGSSIYRQFLSFKECVPWESLAELKTKTNQLEGTFQVGKNRRVNLDCGLLGLDKIVFASTKPANYRIYLGRGIYAQATYRFEKGGFNPWPWTYEEYNEEVVKEFFNQVREKYKEQIDQHCEIECSKE